MKIQVTTAAGKELALPLPNGLLFSPTVIQFVLSATNRKGRSMPKIPPEVADRICATLKSWKETHGSWELVHIESANGDIVTITI